MNYIGYRRKAFANLPNHCDNCSSPKNLTVHHKDKNPNNNRLQNLQILCEDCHNKIHKIYNKRKKVTKKYQKGTPRRKRK